MRLQMRLNRPEDANLAALATNLRWSELVVRDRIELSTFRFSGGRSYRLSYLTWADTQ
jgi:hypothetical protein